MAKPYQTGRNSVRASGAATTLISTMPMKGLEATFEIVTFNRDRAS